MGGPEKGLPANHTKRVKPMDYEEAKELIVDGLQKKQKMKSKFYFNDLAKLIGEKPRAAKKYINQMVFSMVELHWH